MIITMYNEYTDWHKICNIHNCFIQYQTSYKDGEVPTDTINQMYREMSLKLKKSEVHM